MQIFVPGTDARMQALKAEALARGHTLTDAMHCESAMLPLPDSNAAAADLIVCEGKGRLLLHGRLQSQLQTALIERGWQLKNIQEDDSYIRQNALISAEGALYAAMQRLDCTVRGAKCAVIGYGRIGRELTRLLLALGARVHVAARREASRAQAQIDGSLAFDVNDLPLALDGVQVLFNTVPSQIIHRQALNMLANNALLVELASPPYGFDMHLAKEMGFDAVLESGIPTRYAPRSAARLLMDYMEAGELHG